MSGLVKSKQVNNLLFRVNYEEAASSPRDWDSTLATIYAWFDYYGDGDEISEYSDNKEYPTRQDFMDNPPTDAIYWPIGIVDSGGFWLTVRGPYRSPDSLFQQDSTGFAVVTRERAEHHALDFSDLDLLDREVRQELEIYERYLCGDVYYIAVHGTVDTKTHSGEIAKNVLETPLESIGDIHGPTDQYLDELANDLALELDEPFAGVTTEDISGQDWIDG